MMQDIYMKSRGKKQESNGKKNDECMVHGEWEREGGKQRWTSGHFELPQDV